MACKNCDFKGVIKTQMMKDTTTHTVVKMCPYCEDKKAYSLYVKDRYAPKKKCEPMGQVINLAGRRHGSE